jgi:hypothetical protein
VLALIAGILPGRFAADPGRALAVVRDGLRATDP